ncbi:MAG: hypothetical protein ABIH76_03110 [Candidatus Bathyarchaeota archaeon]
MSEASLVGSVVHVRYWDHVLYRNTPAPVTEPAERETIGWLTDINDEVVCIENDRTIDELPYSNGSGSGLVLLKSCIIEIRSSPTQKVSGWPLIPRNTYFRNTESALQTTKRKIQP